MGPNWRMDSATATVLVVTICCALQLVRAGNPIVSDRFIADPSAHVWPSDPDTLYIYVSHDPDNAKSHDEMIDYWVYSTKDLVHWTDHGMALHLDNVTWAEYKAWAPDAAYVNGTYYLVFCAMPKDKPMVTGLAVASTPEGPFQDVGWIEGVTWGQDPCLFVDDDGTPYLYWGLGGNIWSAQLQPDLRSVVPGTKRKLTQELPKAYEGPWVYKHRELGLYYIMYPALRDSNEGQALEYATATSPHGPWTHRGEIMPSRSVSQIWSWTNHGSIVEFKGQWYLFYHTNWLSWGNDKRRSVGIEYLRHNADGTIDPIMPTHEGVSVFDAFNRRSGGGGNGGGSGSGEGIEVVPGTLSGEGGAGDASSPFASTAAGFKSDSGTPLSASFSSNGGSGGSGGGSFSSSGDGGDGHGTHGADSEKAEAASFSSGSGSHGSKAGETPLSWSFRSPVPEGHGRQHQPTQHQHQQQEHLTDGQEARWHHHGGSNDGEQQQQQSHHGGDDQELTPSQEGRWHHHGTGDGDEQQQQQHGGSDGGNNGPSLEVQQAAEAAAERAGAEWASGVHLDSSAGGGERGWGEGEGEGGSSHPHSASHSQSHSHEQQHHHHQDSSGGVHAPPAADHGQQRQQERHGADPWEHEEGPPDTEQQQQQQQQHAAAAAHHAVDAAEAEHRHQQHEEQQHHHHHQEQQRHGHGAGGDSGDDGGEVEGGVLTAQKRMYARPLQQEGGGGHGQHHQAGAQHQSSRLHRTTKGGSPDKETKRRT